MIEPPLPENAEEVSQQLRRALKATEDAWLSMESGFGLLTGD